MGSNEDAMAWRARVKSREAQMQASLRSGSGWLHRFQASQRASSAGGSSAGSASPTGQSRFEHEVRLEENVRSRLKQGEDAGRLWKQIQEALGEDADKKQLARHGWRLHRQASLTRTAPAPASQGPPNLGEGRPRNALLSSTHFALHSAQQERYEEEQRLAVQGGSSSDEVAEDDDDDNEDDRNDEDQDDDDEEEDDAASFDPAAFQPMSLDPAPPLEWQNSQSTFVSQNSGMPLPPAIQRRPSAAPSFADMSLDPAPHWATDFDLAHPKPEPDPHPWPVHNQQQLQQQHAADVTLHSASAHMKRALSIGPLAPRRDPPLSMLDHPPLAFVDGNGELGDAYTLGQPQSALSGASNATDTWHTVTAAAAASADPNWGRNKRLRNM